jgi:sugar/nucleoside kinase (ribokinase family)
VLGSAARFTPGGRANQAVAAAGLGAVRWRAVSATTDFGRRLPAALREESATTGVRVTADAPTGWP